MMRDLYTVKNIKRRGSQQGATLITGLMILVVLTVLGVTGMSNSALQLKMSNNTLQKTVSFEQAENAREAAERRVRALFAGGTFPGDEQGLYDLTNPDVTRPNVTTREFWRTESNFVSVGTTGGYVIEYLGQEEVLLDDRTSSEVMDLYRLSAYGLGRDGVSETVAQAFYMQN